MALHLLTHLFSNLRPILTTMKWESLPMTCQPCDQALHLYLTVNGLPDNGSYSKPSPCHQQSPRTDRSGLTVSPLRMSLPCRLALGEPILNSLTSPRVTALGLNFLITTNCQGQERRCVQKITDTFICSRKRALKLTFPEETQLLYSLRLC